MTDNIMTPNERPDAIAALRDLFREQNTKMHYFIRTFGCQQNVSDSEKMAGLLEQTGCIPAESPDTADIIVFNTCAVREHAEDRVFGNIGRLKSLKEQRPDVILAVGGCMVQQSHIADKLRDMFPFVDIIFNTNELWRLPEHILSRWKQRSRKTLIVNECTDWSIRENLPVKRGEGFRAFVPIMYGCDNFCTYCVVPYVRGRERSRQPDEIEREVRAAVHSGYRDIMLLGQNVNSYGKGLSEEIHFPALLRRLNDIPGDFVIRFMTSHPKDATRELFEAIRDCEKVSRHLHLPVQSGSDEVLRRMNRKYTSGQYLDTIATARALVPDMTFSSDIIVGFPDESDSDFEATMELVRTVGYRSLFTFIYSKREGTAAADMPDATPREVKTARIERLIALQDEISKAQELAMIGTRRRAIVIGTLEDGLLEARLDDTSAVTVSGDVPVNEYCTIEITSRTKKRLFGKVV